MATRRTDFFDGLSETITRTAKELGERAEVFYEGQKLRNKVSSEERMIEKVLADLGNLVYKRFSSGESMDEEITALCKEARQHEEMAARYRDEIAKRKGEKVCPDCGKSVSQEVSFCPYCGSPCPETAEKADSAEEGTPEESMETAAETEETVTEEAPEAEGPQAEEEV